MGGIFPWRTDGGPRDNFERRALQALRKNPSGPYHEFVDFAGRASLRFATARLMEESCLNCHNSHQASPKRDWEIGDVRGVLEIIRPLDRDIVHTRRRLARTYVVMGGLALLLFILTAVVLVAEQGRR